MTLRTQPGFAFENASWIICTEAGAEPTIQNWWGTITDRVYDYRDAIGTCSRPFDKPVVDEPAGLWIIVMLGPIFFTHRFVPSEGINEAKPAGEGR